jgi:hypothetical protein
MNLLDFFDRAYVINLRERPDRRREMERELQRADVGLRDRQLADQVQFFPAVRPAEAAPFSSLGIKGCSLSHVAVLKDAKERGLSRVLVLEDDAEFAPDFLRSATPMLMTLAERTWGIAQLGHIGGPGAPPASAPRLIEFAGEVTGAHCYGVSEVALERLIEHFELQHRGIPGDPLRGPMPADGTLNVFRWLNPDLPRYLVAPSLVRQRSSRSDITPGHVDRVAFLRPLVALARAIRARRWPRPPHRPARTLPTPHPEPWNAT